MNTWWYVNRAAGLVSWALLGGSIIMGLLLSSKAAGKALRANWMTDLHRGLSALSLAFVGVHIAGALGDHYVHFGLADVLVPGASAWRPLAIAWGVVTLYLLIAVEVSSLLKKKISKAVWRRIHFLSFPLFITATAHVVTAGTDIRNVAVIALLASVSAAIMGLTVFRVLDALEQGKAAPAAPRVPVRATTAQAPHALRTRPARPARPAAAPQPTRPLVGSTTRPSVGGIPLAPRGPQPTPRAPRSF